MLDTSTVLALIVFAMFLYQLSRTQERLRSTEAKLDALLKHFDIEWGRFSEPSERVKQLAKDPATRIQAIKAYREQTGLGLKDAMEVVERLANE